MIRQPYTTEMVMASLSTWRARSPLPAPAFCAVSALTVAPMELGTINKKLIIFFDQAYGGGINQAAVVGDDGDEHKRHLDAAVLHGYGHADLKDAAEHLGLGRRSLRLR